MRRAPVWLLGLFAFGQIKYGIWTVTAWVLFWKNTAGLAVPPELMFQSVFMTITHLAMIGQDGGATFLGQLRPGQRPFDLHPDGNRFVVSATTAYSAQPMNRLVLVTNFFDKLQSN